MVEDSATTAALLTKYLSGAYRLLHASDGVLAWRILELNPDIDLLITDVHMPNMSGHELLIKIRQSEIPRFQSLPVIVMTTTDDNTDRNRAFQNGANDFITKPIDETEMRARINVHYKLAHTIRELEESQRILGELATTDPLTKLKNRRAFFDNGDKAMSMLRRYDNEISVIVLDMDHFKKINDSFGHQTGDEALQIVARILLKLMRTEDTVARIGGEEFAILLPGANRLGATILGERIRVAVESEPFTSNGKPVPMTVSIGIATHGVDPATTMDQLIALADDRLYIAKRNGRNRVCFSNDDQSAIA